MKAGSIATSFTIPWDILMHLNPTKRSCAIVPRDDVYSSVNFMQYVLHKVDTTVDRAYIGTLNTFIGIDFLINEHMWNFFYMICIVVVYEI